MSSGFSFGLTSSNSNTSGFSFGSQTGGLNLGGGGGGIKPLGSTTPAATTTTTPAATTTTGGLNFSGLGGGSGTTGSLGFNLGGSSAASNTPSSTTNQANTTNPSTSFGGLGLNLGGNTASSGATSTLGLGLGGGLGGGLSGGLGGGLGLGGTAKIGGTNTNTTNPLGSTTGSALGSLGTNSTATTSTTTAASSGSSQAPITFKVLEDYINKWTSDLDAQEKDFLNQATQLNALDKLMVENGDKIIDLSNEVTRLTGDQDQLEQELNFIHSQQNDLEQAIRKLEQGIEQMPLIIPQQQPSPYYQSNMISGDTSRIEMYKLLIEVDNQLKSTSCDVRDIVKRLNETNVNLNDPIVQISKILNSHMDSLNWIEENSVMLQTQVDKVAKLIDDRYREPDPSTSRFMFLTRD